MLYEVTASADPKEKRQASQIRLKARTYDGAQASVLPKDASKPVHMVVVTNNSPRLIRNLAAAISVPGGPPLGKAADMVGRIEQAHLGSTATVDTLVAVVRSSRLDLLDTGENAAFAWPFDTETYPKAELGVALLQ